MCKLPSAFFSYMAQAWRTVQAKQISVSTYLSSILKSISHFINVGALTVGVEISHQLEEKAPETVEGDIVAQYDSPKVLSHLQVRATDRLVQSHDCTGWEDNFKLLIWYYSTLLAPSAHQENAFTFLLLGQHGQLVHMSTRWPCPKPLQTQDTRYMNLGHVWSLLEENLKAKHLYCVSHTTQAPKMIPNIPTSGKKRWLTPFCGASLNQWTHFLFLLGRELPGFMDDDATPLEDWVLKSGDKL